MRYVDYLRLEVSKATPEPDNLIDTVDPTFETGTTTGWSPGSPAKATLALTTDQAHEGVKSLEATALGNEGFSVNLGTADTYRIPATVGKAYTGSAWTRAAATARNVRILIYFYDVADALISTHTGSYTANSPYRWTRHEHTAVAPANTDTMIIQVQFDNAVTDEVQYLDDVSLAWADQYPVNLVKNPDGEQGAWFWPTPVANTTMTTGTDANGTYLKFLNSAAQTAYATSSWISAAEGQSVRGQITVVDVTSTTSGVALAFEWYDSSKTIISTTAETAVATTNTTIYTTSYAAPANTAWVKMKVRLYTSASGQPGVGDFVTFRNAMVMLRAGSVATDVATNHSTCPSFEGTTADAKGKWGEYQRCTIAVTTDQAWVGSKSLAMTANALTSGLMEIRSLPNSITAGPNDLTLANLQDYAVDVTPGENMTVSAYFRAGSTGRKTRIAQWYYNAAGDLLGTAAYDSTVKDSNTAWRRHSVTYTVPSTAAYMYVTLGVQSVGGGEIHYVDGVMIEQSGTANTYFDGDTTDTATLTYGWSGVAHQSTSTRTTAGDAFDYVQAVEWTDVLSGTHEIQIDRTGLDVGTLHATLTDPDLDPSVYDEIRPGKRVRLRALIDDEYQNVYEGTLERANVNYKRDGKVLIDFDASDAVSTLANQTGTQGVENIDDLPYILEDAGVPWVVNGSSDQVTSANVVSENENASVLDQVALTRDTALGYAWVDRYNVLHAYDTLPTTTVVTFTDVAADIASDPTAYVGYCDIDAAFSTESVINDVTVTWLRYKSTTGETTEVVYGPYQDTTSIAEWGARRENFTIHGGSESSTAIDDYADRVLGANAIPKIHARTLRMPVRDDDELALAVTTDLYDKVAVVFDDKVNSTYRVTGITHQITPTDWTVDYAFDVPDAVAAPQVTPSPTKGVGVTVNTMEALHLTRGTDASTAAGNAPALRIADLTGNHMRVDSNEIIAMSADSTQSTLHVNPGGGSVIGLGDTVSAIAFGDDAVTTDASAIATITHGLGTTPVAVLITFRNNGTNHIATVTARTSTTFSFRVVNDAGANTASATRNVCWIAIA